MKFCLGEIDLGYKSFHQIAYYQFEKAIGVSRKGSRTQRIQYALGEDSLVLCDFASLRLCVRNLRLYVFARKLTWRNLNPKTN